ncbi:MAG: hypothetical protein EOP42_09135 [Sphingobacteriaceae bacterium]|nr:MAG: hypothetical protein EOP42_09135 [Sphingobacteriaceae bacterium]
MEKALKAGKAKTKKQVIEEALKLFIKLEPYDIALKAASLNRKLRKAGKMIRKANDCSIAIYAIENSIPLLHNGKEFDFIAEGTELQIPSVL